MTLNCVMALILRYFTESNSVAFGADYVRVVEDRPILIVWDKSVAQRIQFFLAIYHLYSQKLLRTSTLLTSTCAIYYIKFAIHREDRIQHIEMRFAPYGRAMLDALDARPFRDS